MKEQVVTISNKTIVRTIIIIVGFILAWQFIYATRGILTLIGISFFLAMALNPPVSYIARRLPKGNRGLATGIAYLVVIGLLSLLLYVTVPPLVRQTSQLINNLPEYIENLKTEDNYAADTLRRLDLVDTLQESEDQIRSQLTKAGGTAFNVLQRVFSSLAAVLTVLVLTFFMLVEAPVWLERFWAIQDKSKLKHRQELLRKMYKIVTSYVNGQLLIAFLGGVSTYIILRILDLPYALPLAAIIGLFGLIPLIGATIGAIIVVIVALFNSVTTAVIVLVYYLVYQQVENNVIQPAIQSKTIDISPLMIIIAALLGATIAGLFGALIALPIAACLRILFNDYILHKNPDKAIKI